MRKVYVLHDRCGLNFAGANKYGEQVYVLDSKTHPADVAGIREAVVEMIRKWQSDDIIVVTSSIVSAIAMAIVASCLKPFQNSINVLIYDAKSEKYIERRLEL